MDAVTETWSARRIDGVVTVGTGGDKMFWGRLAAWRAGVPAICSALHSVDHAVYGALQDRVDYPGAGNNLVYRSFFALPPLAGGNVVVRVTDTDRGQGNRSLDLLDADNSIRINGWANALRRPCPRAAARSGAIRSRTR